MGEGWSTLEKRKEKRERKRCHDDDEKYRRREIKGKKHDILESKSMTDLSVVELEKKKEIVLEEYTKLTLNWVPLPLQMTLKMTRLLTF